MTQIIISLGLFAGEIALTAVIWIIGRRVKAWDALKEQFEAKADQLIELKAAKAAESVEAKFVLIKSHYESQLREIGKRLEKGDQVFDRIEEQSRRFEILLTTNEGRTKEWARDLLAKVVDDLVTEKVCLARRKSGECA